jgi:hypothetical protein
LRLKKNTRFIILLVGVFALGVATGALIFPISIIVGSGAISVIALLRDVFKDVLAYGRRPSIKSFCDKLLGISVYMGCLSFTRHPFRFVNMGQNYYVESGNYSCYSSVVMPKTIASGGFEPAPFSCNVLSAVG